MQAKGYVQRARFLVLKENFLFVLMNKNSSARSCLSYVRRGAGSMWNVMIRLMTSFVAQSKDECFLFFPFHKCIFAGTICMLLAVSLGSTLYAAPNGTSAPFSACDAVNPCSLPFLLVPTNSLPPVQDGDTVFLVPGVYKIPIVSFNLSFSNLNFVGLSAGVVLNGFGFSLTGLGGGKLMFANFTATNFAPLFTLSTSSTLIVEGVNVSNVVGFSYAALTVPSQMPFPSARQVVLSDCIFIDVQRDITVANLQYTLNGAGSAIDILAGRGMPVTLSVNRCQFIRNSYTVSDVSTITRGGARGPAIFANGGSSNSPNNYFFGDIHIYISECYFFNNTVYHVGGSGGAIWASALNANGTASSSLIIRNSIFRGNLARQSGGAVYANVDNVLLENVLFAGNSASLENGVGSALFLRGWTAPFLWQNITFRSNTYLGSVGTAAALSYQGNQSGLGLCDYCYFLNNTGQTASGIYQFGGSAGNVSFSHCAFCGGMPKDLTCSGMGSISLIPESSRPVLSASCSNWLVTGGSSSCLSSSFDVTAADLVRPPQLKSLPPFGGYLLDTLVIFNGNVVIPDNMLIASAAQMAINDTATQTSVFGIVTIQAGASVFLNVSIRGTYLLLNATGVVGSFSAVTSQTGTPCLTYTPVSILVTVADSPCDSTSRGLSVGAIIGISLASVIGGIGIGLALVFVGITLNKLRTTRLQAQLKDEQMRNLQMAAHTM